MSEPARDDQAAGAAGDRIRPLAYGLLLPALVALLPVLLPIPLYRRWGAGASYVPWLLPGWPMIVIGLVWARQVLVATEDDLLRRAAAGLLPAADARTAMTALRVLVLGGCVLLPLRYEGIARGACDRAFERHGGPALAALQMTLASHRDRWRAEYAPTRAFAPPAGELAPDRFGGPFAPRDGGIGKLVFDSEQRAWYVLDRPRGLGPSILDWIREGVCVVIGGEESTLSPDPWTFERGLVHVGSGADRPRRTVWGMDLVWSLDLGDGWFWYVAAAETDG